jgi:hypothetical protein
VFHSPVLILCCIFPFHLWYQGFISKLFSHYQQQVFSVSSCF